MSVDENETPTVPAQIKEDERTILLQPLSPIDIPPETQDLKYQNMGDAPEAEVSTPLDMEDDDRTILVPDTLQRQKVEHGPMPISKAGREIEHQDQNITEELVSRPNSKAVPNASTMTNAAPVMPIPLGRPLSSLEIGTVINNMYRVVEKLDQGGMGKVFRGEEIGTGESVAIKVILPEMAEDEQVAAMFKREARTLRQLHHDAIVRYFAYVPPDENLNLHALVMGFIQGTKLSDALKSQGALSRDQVINLTIRLADGLEGAHKVGVVHRDLSPDNVMLENGEINKAVLIDFGISRSSTIKDVTIGNEFAGKLKYVSPEQLGAFGGEAEAPSDVYSLGLLMIAMLTGKPLGMGASIVDAVQMRQSVPDLSNINPEFQNLLTKMLQPDPAQRLPSMRDVTDELLSLDGVSGFGSSFMRKTLPPVKVVDQAVPGLQAVPFGVKSGGFEAASDKVRVDRATEVKESGPRVLLKVVIVLAVAALAPVAYILKDNLPFSTVEIETSNTSDPAVDGLKRVKGSPETFLAEAVSDKCAYASLRKHGPNAGLIEVLSENLSQLRDIGDSFRDQFDTKVDIMPRSTPSVHCNGLNFANTFQGTSGASVELSLKANTLSSGSGIKGTLHGSEGRKSWLALVDTNGKIFSLMKKFHEPIGSERYFEFRLTGAPPGIYMLIATASGKTLVRSGAMKDGISTKDFLPLLSRELALDGKGASDITYLELTR